MSSNKDLGFVVSGADLVLPSYHLHPGPLWDLESASSVPKHGHSVESVRIQRDHSRVQLLGIFGRLPKDPTPIQEILLRIRKMPCSVRFLGPFVAGYNIHWIQSFNSLYRADPFLSFGLRVGLEEHLMDIAVDDIAANSEFEVRHPEDGGIVRIGVSNFNGLEEPAALQVKLVPP